MEVNYKMKCSMSTIILIQTAVMLNTLELNRESFMCKYNFYFDDQWMDCIKCPLGSFGMNCSQQWETGLYGHLCQVPCECNAQHCNPANGCHSNVSLKELSSPSSVRDDPTVDGHILLTQSEAPTSIFESASSEKPREITEFLTSLKPSTSSSSTTSSTSDKTEQNNHWMLVASILIALIAAAFVGGVFNALKPKCRMPVVCNARSSSQDHANINDQNMNKIIQQRDIPRTYDEETRDYDEIQKSQLNQQLNPAQCTSFEFRRENDVSEYRSSNSQRLSMYKIISFNCDYNILLLKQKQSTAIYDHDWRSTGVILGTDENFVTLIGGESLNLHGTAEDNIFETLPGNFNFSRMKGESCLDFSHRLTQSSSESQLSEFKYAPNLSENYFDTLWNEEGLYCEKESIEVAEGTKSISQENIQREVQRSEVEEFKLEIEITRF